VINAVNDYCYDGSEQMLKTLLEQNKEIDEAVLRQVRCAAPSLEAGLHSRGMLVGAHAAYRQFVSTCQHAIAGGISFNWLLISNLSTAFSGC
jgi:hypothetical protein